jgi:hypothetical protein
MNQTSDTLIFLNERLAAPRAAEAGRGYAPAYHVAVLLLCVTVLAGAFLLQPREDGLSLLGCRWPFHCRLHQTFGIKCALCGMSRSFCCLAHGDVMAGLAFHRLGPAAFAVACLEIPYRLYALTSRSRTQGGTLHRAHTAAVALVAVAIFANWLLYLGGFVL